MHFIPHASINDGELDVSYFGMTSALRMIKILDQGKK